MSGSRSAEAHDFDQALSLALAIAGGGDRVRTDAAFATALQAAERDAGVESLEVALCAQHWASVIAQRGETRMALPLLERALAIHERHLGIDVPTTLVLAADVIPFLQAVGRLDDADALALRVVRNCDTLVATAPNIRALSQACSYLHTRGRDKDARRAQIRLVDLSVLLNGLLHPDTARVTHDLAQHYLHSGDLKEAAQLLQRATQQYRHVLTEAHPLMIQMRQTYQIALASVNADALRRYPALLPAGDSNLPVSVPILFAPQVRAAVVAADPAQLDAVLRQLPPAELGLNTLVLLVARGQLEPRHADVATALARYYAQVQRDVDAALAGDVTDRDELRIALGDQERLLRLANDTDHAGQALADRVAAQAARLNPPPEKPQQPTTGFLKRIFGS